MCLAVPMQIESIDDLTARCRARGVEREVSLLLLQDEALQAGDFILVHLDCATQRISAADAQAAWELYDRILAADGSS